MILVSTLPHAEFGPNDHSKGAFNFRESKNEWKRIKTNVCKSGQRRTVRDGLCQLKSSSNIEFQFIRYSSDKMNVFHCLIQDLLPEFEKFCLERWNDFTFQRDSEPGKLFIIYIFLFLLNQIYYWYYLDDIEAIKYFQTCDP